MSKRSEYSTSHVKTQLIAPTGVGTKSKAAEPHRFRFSLEQSNLLMELWDGYNGNWFHIIKDDDYKLLGCTKAQAENHLKYIRKNKNKKRNGGSG